MHEIVRHSRTRDYQADNLRFFLIFSVVMGHGMELFLFGLVPPIYCLIYTFHMPAFLYLTGRFAKFDRKKLLKRFILPYLVFQTLFLLFESRLPGGKPFTLQFTTPYWILWYLLAVIVYYILLPLLPPKDSKWSPAVIAGSVAVSLLAGFDDSLGYYLSLSRILVFAPFFLFGYYESALAAGMQELLSSRRFRTAGAIGCGAAVLAGLIYVFAGRVPVNLLFGSYSYAGCGAAVWDRAVVLLLAAAWIGLFRALVPRRRIPLITDLGQHTMPIFLLHPFVIRLLQHSGVFRFSVPVNLLLLLAAAAAIVAAFGNRYVSRFFAKLF